MPRSVLGDVGRSTDADSGTGCGSWWAFCLVKIGRVSMDKPDNTHYTEAESGFNFKILIMIRSFATHL